MERGRAKSGPSSPAPKPRLTPETAHDLELIADACVATGLPCDRRLVYAALVNRFAAGNALEELRDALLGMQLGQGETAHAREQAVTSPFALVFASTESVSAYAHEGRKHRELADLPANDWDRRKEPRSQARQRAAVVGGRP